MHRLRCKMCGRFCCSAEICVLSKSCGVDEISEISEKTEIEKTRVNL